MTWWQIVLTCAAVAGAVFAEYHTYGAPDGLKGLKAVDPDFEWPDMKFHYNAAFLRGTFDRLGETGLPMLQKLWRFDFLFIVCFAVLMLAVGENVARGHVLYLPMAIAAMVRGVLDAAENCLLLRCSRRRFSDRLGNAVGYVTSIKFITMGAWVLMLFTRLFLRATNIN